MPAANGATPQTASCPIHDQPQAVNAIRQDNTRTFLATADRALRQTKDRKPLHNDLARIGKNPDEETMAALIGRCENAEPGLGHHILEQAATAIIQRQTAFLNPERRRIIRQWLLFYALLFLTLAAVFGLTGAKHLWIPTDHWAYLPATVTTILAATAAGCALGAMVTPLLVQLLRPTDCRCLEIMLLNATEHQ